MCFQCLTMHQIFGLCNLTYSHTQILEMLSHLKIFWGRLWARIWLMVGLKNCMSLPSELLIFCKSISEIYLEESDNSWAEVSSFNPTIIMFTLNQPSKWPLRVTFPIPFQNNLSENQPFFVVFSQWLLVYRRGAVVWSTCDLPLNVYFQPHHK